MEFAVLGGGVGGGAGDDEGGAGFVDEDGVDFVDDGEVVSSLLYHVFGGVGHVVAEVVEAEFGVGAVGDVAEVHFAALGWGHHVFETADGEAEPCVEVAHPFGVALGVVVGGGDDVNAFAGEGVEVDGEGGDEGFAFAGGHFGNHAVVDGHAADELYVEVNHFPGEVVPADFDGGAAESAGGVFDDGEGFEFDLFEGGAVGEAFFEFGGFVLKLLIGERFVLFVEGFDLLYFWSHFFEIALILRADNLFQNPVHSFTASD